MNGLYCLVMTPDDHLGYSLWTMCYVWSRLDLNRHGIDRVLPEPGLGIPLHFEPVDLFNIDAAGPSTKLVLHELDWWGQLSWLLPL